MQSQSTARAQRVDFFEGARRLHRVGQLIWILACIYWVLTTAPVVFWRYRTTAPDVPLSRTHRCEYSDLIIRRQLALNSIASIGASFCFETSEYVIAIEFEDTELIQVDWAAVEALNPPASGPASSRSSPEQSSKVKSVDPIDSLLSNRTLTNKERAAPRLVRRYLKVPAWSSQADSYTRRRAESFNLSEAEQSHAFREWLSLRFGQIAIGLGAAALGVATLSLIALAIGWVVRGFLGISAAAK